MNFFVKKWAIFRQKKGIRIFELFTLTIHYIRISACSYSLTNTNYSCPNYSNNRIFEYRIKNPSCKVMRSNRIYPARPFSQLAKQKLTYIHYLFNLLNIEILFFVCNIAFLKERYKTLRI